MKLYDVLGRLVHQQTLEKSKIGMNEVLIKPEGFSAGVYFVQVEAGDFKQTEKLILLR